MSQTRYNEKFIEVLENLSTIMLNFAKKKYKKLIAKISLRNKISITFHRKLGFEEIKRDKKMLYLRL